MVRVGHALAKTVLSFFLIWQCGTLLHLIWIIFLFFLFFQIWRCGTLLYLIWIILPFFIFFSNLMVWHFASSDMNCFTFFKSDGVALCFILNELFNSHVEN